MKNRILNTIKDILMFKISLMSRICNTEKQELNILKNCKV
jgi:hypothetical protein